MNKKLIEYLIIATAVVLLIYCCYAMISYDYLEKKENVTDSIFMWYPASLGYSISGDTVEFRDSQYSFYNMDVSKLNSSSQRVTNLLNHFSNVNQGTVDLKNETCYVVTIEFLDDSGFNYHSLVIPTDSFDRNDMAFRNSTDVYVFDGNNRDYILDEVFNSEVAL